MCCALVSNLQQDIPYTQIRQRKLSCEISVKKHKRLKGLPADLSGVVIFPKLSLC